MQRTRYGCKVAPRLMWNIGKILAVLVVLVSDKGHCRSDHLGVSPSLQVIVVTQATPNISDYAEWSLKANEVYCQRHGYEFVVAREEAEFYVGDERDVRWSKVKILQKLISQRQKSDKHQQPQDSPDPAQEEADQTKDQAERAQADSEQGHPQPSTHASAHALTSTVYFWIDADAVIVDFDRKLEDLFAAHTNVEFLICAESDGGTMANTGAFFLRSSEWAERFLSAWWQSAYAHSETLRDGRHEQKALDHVIAENTWVARAVHVLPTQAFNTVPPFYTTTTKSSFILHLMFEPYGNLRQRVFRTVYNAINISAHTLDISTIIPHLCTWAEESYRLALRVSERDADLTVMTAQLLIECRGRDAVREAMDMYRSAVEYAPRDPDTHRLLASRVLHFWREYGWGDVCECGVHVATASALETNQMRVEEIRWLRADCEDACAQDKRRRKATGGGGATGEDVEDNTHVPWGSIVMLAMGVLVVVVTPILCGLLRSVVKEKED